MGQLQVPGVGEVGREVAIPGMFERLREGMEGEQGPRPQKKKGKRTLVGWEQSWIWSQSRCPQPCPQVGCGCEEAWPKSGASAPGVCLSKSCKAPSRSSSPSPRREMDDLSDKGNRFHHSVIRQRRSPEPGRGGPRACHSGGGGGGGGSGFWKNVGDCAELAAKEAGRS